MPRLQQRPNLRVSQMTPVIGVTLDMHTLDVVYVGAPVGGSQQPRIIAETIEHNNKPTSVMHEFLERYGITTRRCVMCISNKNAVVFVERFASRLNQAQRIQNIRMKIEDARVVGEDLSRNDLAILVTPLLGEDGRPMRGNDGKPTNEYLVAVTLQNYIDMAEDFAAQVGLSLSLLTYEAHAWRKALPPNVDGCVVVNAVGGASVSLFSSRYEVGAEFDAQLNYTWHEALGEFLAKQKDLKSGFNGERLAVLGEGIVNPGVGDLPAVANDPFVLQQARTREIIDNVAKDTGAPYVDVPVITSPMDGNEIAAPKWMLAYGLARCADGEVPNFLTLSGRRRISSALSSARARILTYGASVAAAIVIVMASVLIAQVNLRTLDAQLLQKQAEVARLDQQRATDQVQIGGQFGDLGAIMPRIAHVRSSGDEAAGEIEVFGNARPEGLWFDTLSRKNQRVEVDGGTVSLDRVSRLLLNLKNSGYAPDFSNYSPQQRAGKFYSYTISVGGPGAPGVTATPPPTNTTNLATPTPGASPQ